MSCLSIETDPRIDERRNVFLSAVLAVRGRVSSVKIRNISARGALLDATDIPADDEFTLRRGGLAVRAQVAWRHKHHVGVRFESEIDPGAWLKKIGHQGQQSVDGVVAAIKSGLDPAQCIMPAQAASVAEQCGVIEQSLERLASRPEISLEVAEELLRIDAAVQNLRGTARMSAAPDRAVGKPCDAFSV